MDRKIHKKNDYASYEYFIADSEKLFNKPEDNWLIQNYIDYV